MEDTRDHDISILSELYVYVRQSGNLGADLGPAFGAGVGCGWLGLASAGGGERWGWRAGRSIRSLIYMFFFIIAAHCF